MVRFRNTDGKRIRTEAGGARKHCCCVTCNIVADFSYENNLTLYGVDFFDESTSDCSIISWDWDFGDGSTSTLQDPSHTFSDAGPHTISLTVTDDCGCEDTVIKEISFGNSLRSCCCDTDAAYAYEVTLSNFSGTPSCGAIGGTVTYADLNGTYYLIYRRTITGECQYSALVSGTHCNRSPYYLTLSVLCSSGNVVFAAAVSQDTDGDLIGNGVILASTGFAGTESTCADLVGTSGTMAKDFGPAGTGDWSIDALIPWVV